MTKERIKQKGDTAHFSSLNGTSFLLFELSTLRAMFYLAGIFRTLSWVGFLNIHWKD